MLRCDVTQRASRREAEQCSIHASQPHQLRHHDGENHEQPDQVVLDHPQILRGCHTQPDPGDDRAPEDQERLHGHARSHRAAAPEWERQGEHADKQHHGREVLQDAHIQHRAGERAPRAAALGADVADDGPGQCRRAHRRHGAQRECHHQRVAEGLVCGEREPGADGEDDQRDK